MTAVHARAARREREAATLLGTRRVHRGRFERARDVEPVRLADGTVIVVEAKSRKALPRWLVRAVAQARGYLPGCVPLVALSELGGEPFGLLPLRDLARLLGLQPSDSGAQLLLAPGSGGRAA